MRALLRQSIVTLALMAILWLAFHHVLYGYPNIQSVVDTDDEIFRLTHPSPLAHLVEEFHLLSRTDRPKLVFIGGSSAEYAFRRAHLAPLFPEYEVHCLAVHGAYGGRWMQETFEIMKAAFAAIPPQSRLGSVFLFGTILPTFYPASLQQTEVYFTPARIQLFPRLYVENGTEAAPRFGMAATTCIHRIIRPFWILRRVLTIGVEVNDIYAGIKWLKQNESDHGADPGTEGFDDIENPGRVKAVLQHAKQMHQEDSSEKMHFSQESIACLDRMLTFVHDNELQCVLILLPYSDTQRDGVLNDFSQTIQGMVAQYNGSDTLHFLDHSSAMPTSCMYDLYHIKRSASKQYAMILRESWPQEL